MTSSVDRSVNAGSLPTVAVVGAGITGLLAAQGLLKNGFKVVVFEQEMYPKSHSRDWTIIIRWAIPLMSRLLPDKVMADFSKAVCNPHLDFDQDVESVPYYNGLTGELLFKMSLPGARQITRQRLRSILLQGVDVRWGTKVTGITSDTNSIKLYLEGGGVHDADFLLGADGPSSAIREIVLGSEAAMPRPSGILFATGIANYKDAEKTQKVTDAHPVAAIMLGINVAAGCGIMHVDDFKDMSTWTTFWAMIWKGETLRLRGDEALEYLKAREANLCEPFKSAIKFTPEIDGSQCYIDEMRYWAPVPWDDHGGRLSLAGDAAHPMLPFRGQGLQNAIEDVINYVEALHSVGTSRDAERRKRIIAEYNAEIVKRGSEAVKQSVQEAENSLDPEKASKLLRASSYSDRGDEAYRRRDCKQ